MGLFNKKDIPVSNPIVNEPTKRVYCRNCIHIKKNDRMAIGYSCLHPDNIRMERNFYHEYPICTESPSKLNENNDCQLYTEFSSEY